MYKIYASFLIQYATIEKEKNEYISHYISIMSTKKMKRLRGSNAMKKSNVGTIVMLLCVVIFMFSACSQKEESENTGNVITEDGVQNGATEADATDTSNSDAGEGEENSTNTVEQGFPKDYETILNWATIRVGQKGVDMREVSQQEEEYISLLQKNALVGYTSSFFVPYDTLSGTLEDIRTNGGSTEDILVLIKSFFTDISNGNIDTNIGKYVLTEEIPVIIRQVAFSQDYGEYITGYRVGKLINAQQDRRYTNIRVIAQFPDFESRVELIIYFNFVNSSWFISAIEGDINELLVPYTTTKRFEPSGTTGVTQGF